MTDRRIPTYEDMAFVLDKLKESHRNVKTLKGIDDMGTSRTKRLLAKKAVKKKVVLPKSLNNPTLALVIEFDHDDDLSGLLDSIQELLDRARENGEVMSACLSNVPATLDCTKLDRRY